jgi:diaminopimelate epimerase
MVHTIERRRGVNGTPGARRTRALEFTKWTSFGNTFVLLDESQGSALTEAEKSRFAFQATNAWFGVGSDNFLVIQKCTKGVLQGIHQARGYWPALPEASQADFVFRMFEPDGEEAFSCGNGLMAVAAYLRQRHGMASARVLTEVPCASPRPVRIGTDAAERSWASLGAPRRIPDDLVSAAIKVPCNEQMDRLAGLTIRFRQHDLAPYIDSVALDIWGYLVFTGEPHLVVFPADVIPSQEVVQTLFADPGGKVRAEFGSRLMHRIGWAINNELPALLPRGLNVNFARVTPDGGAVEYRCFERGIQRETLACGTGAVAVAVVCHALGMWKGERCELWPYSCRRYDPTAAIGVDRKGNSWVLSGRPKALFRGVFPWTPSSAPRRRSDTGRPQRRPAGQVAGDEARPHPGRRGTA